MRLLFVSHSLPPADQPMANVGGMQRVALELHEALGSDRDLAYDALLLRTTWAASGWKTPLFMARVWAVLWWRAVRGEVDVVLFSSMVTAALVWPLAGVFRRCGVRTAAIVHGLDVTTPFAPWQGLVRRVFARIDLVLPVSAATGGECVARGLAPERVRPVRNGVDVGRFPPLVSAPPARRALLRAMEPGGDALPERDGLVLLSVGRHVRRKGFAWFVRSVMPLLPADVHYWIAGEGPESADIALAVRETGMENRVRLLGRVSENALQTLYRGADLFLMPNVPVEHDVEGFGIVMLEAGLGGLTTVGSDLEGIAEVITENANGHRVTPGDAAGFAERILRYHGDPDRRLRSADRTRTHTLRHFGWQAVASEYVHVLRSLHHGDAVPAIGTPVGVPVAARPA